MGVNSSGFTNEQSPLGGAFNRDLLDQKSKSLLFPGCVCVGGGGGGGGHVIYPYFEKCKIIQNWLVQLLVNKICLLWLFFCLFVINPKGVSVHDASQDRGCF